MSAELKTDAIINREALSALRTCIHNREMADCQGDFAVLQGKKSQAYFVYFKIF